MNGGGDVASWAMVMPEDALNGAIDQILPWYLKRAPTILVMRSYRVETPSSLSYCSKSFEE